MEYITLKPEEAAEIIKQLAEIKTELKENKKKNALTETWWDIQDVCQTLHISKRLLQSWRSESPPRIPFSQYQNKIWFKASDVEAFLESNYIKGRKK